MKLKNLREWLKIVPEEYDDCQLVFRDIIAIPDSEDLMAGDDPITSATVDVGSREICFYNRKSYELIKDLPDGDDVAETLEPEKEN